MASIWCDGFFSAVPGVDDTTAHSEAVVESVIASLKRGLMHHEPTHVVGVFDGQGPSWRHRIYPPYKSQRRPMPEALRAALPAIVCAIEQAGVNCLIFPGYEADDLLASIAIKVAARNGNVIILSTDTSLCQLLGPRIGVYDHFSDRTLDDDFVRHRFNVDPSKLIDLLALVGIQSSSIPGIKGIGPKTAGRLIAEFGDLDAVLAAGEDIQGRTGRLLVEGKNNALLSRQLVTLSVDIELGVNLSQFRLMARAERDATIPRQPE